MMGAEADGADATDEVLLTIGEAAARSGVTAKMIRHYEHTGLVPAPTRTAAGYRLYTRADVHRLRFIRRARTLGFGMKQVGLLLALWSDRSRASADVRRLALQHAADLGERIAQMQAMQRTLESLARRCHADQRPECPILEDLEHGTGIRGD